MAPRSILSSMLLLAAAAGPAWAGGPRSGPRKPMKPVSVVDHLVGDRVVKRVITLREGGSARRAKPITLERELGLLSRGLVVSDHEGGLPESLTLKGRLHETDHRVTATSGGRRRATITLERPRAEELTGELATRIHVGGRIRTIRRAAMIERRPSDPLGDGRDAEFILRRTLQAERPGGNAFQLAGEAWLGFQDSHPRALILHHEHDGKVIDWVLPREGVREALSRTHAPVTRNGFTFYVGFRELKITRQVGADREDVQLVASDVARFLDDSHLKGLNDL